MDQKDSCSAISIAGIAGDNAPRACSWVGRPMMFNITAVMYPQDSCDMVLMCDCRKLRTLRSCSPSRSSTSLSSCRGRSPWSRPFRRPLRLPSCCSISDGRCPVVHFVQVHFPSWRRVCFLWSRLLVGPLRLRSCSTCRIVDVPVVLVVQPPGGVQTCGKLWFPQLQFLSRRLHARCCARQAWRLFRVVYTGTRPG